MSSIVSFALAFVILESRYPRCVPLLQSPRRSIAFRWMDIDVAWFAHIVSIAKAAATWCVDGQQMGESPAHCGHKHARCRPRYQRRNEINCRTRAPCSALLLRGLRSSGIARSLHIFMQRQSAWFCGQRISIDLPPNRSGSV